MNIYEINIEKLRKIEPGLSPAGRTNYPSSTALSNEFSEDELEQIEICIDWLRKKSVQKSLNMNIDSICINQLIRRETQTYICSGAVVAAILHLGLDYKPTEHGSPAVYVNIGTKELYKNDPLQAEERRKRKEKIR